jgi:hypothetical protein
MKRKKLSLDKLVLGSLSEAEQSNVIGGDDGTGSVVYVNNVCVSNTTYQKTSFTATCPLTQLGCVTSPKTGTNITCVSTHQY